MRDSRCRSFHLKRWTTSTGTSSWTTTGVPRNNGRLDSPDVTSDEYNPICGDRVILDLSISEGLIADAAFTGEGCSITQASASMMTELLPGLTPSEALSLWKTFDRMMDGDETAATELQGRGDLHSLSAVRRFPVRIKCALLAWKALEMGLEEGN